MTKNRYYPRINITLPQSMLDDIGRCQEKLQLRRSTIIQLALRDWLAKQPITQAPLIVGGKLYDPEQPYTYYLNPDMTQEEQNKTFEEFDAAYNATFNKPVY